MRQLRIASTSLLRRSRRTKASKGKGAVRAHRVRGNSDGRPNPARSKTNGGVTGRPSEATGYGRRSPRAIAGLEDDRSRQNRLTVAATLLDSLGVGSGTSRLNLAVDFCLIPYCSSFLYRLLRGVSRLRPSSRCSSCSRVAVHEERAFSASLNSRSVPGGGSGPGRLGARLGRRSARLCDGGRREMTHANLRRQILDTDDVAWRHDHQPLDRVAQPRMLPLHR